jgi:hypothetical protein
MLLALVLSAQQATQVAIYVGPKTRNGFIDADLGVMDSIKDVQAAIRGERAFRLVNDESQADVKLYILGRGKGPDGGAAGTFAGGVFVAIPTDSYHVDAMLEVGDYSRPIVGQSVQRVTGTWSRCAHSIVHDLKGWVEVNREKLTKK